MGGGQVGGWAVAWVGGRLRRGPAPRLNRPAPQRTHLLRSCPCLLPPTNQAHVDPDHQYTVRGRVGH